MGGVAMVVNYALQDNEEVALTVEECLGALSWEEDGDVSGVHGPKAIGEALAVKASDHFLQVYEADEVVV